MDWDKLRIFHAVASAGSFTHAGQMLTLSQSAVSRTTPSPAGVRPLARSAASPR